MRRSLLLWIGLLAAQPQAGAQKFFSDDPMLIEPPPRDASKAISRKLSDYYDAVRHLLATPGDRQKSARPVLAGAVNTLGDPMDGAWYTKRHYWKRMTPAELAAGPSRGVPPSNEGVWTITRVKSEGVTPGFTVRDRTGTVFYLKFDPKSNPEIATAADLITNRLFHALGYHVSENYIVSVTADRLVIAPGVQIEDVTGRRRVMSARDFQETLAKAPRAADGSYRATASLALPGKDIGPYRYYGLRADDPNDTVPHEHRRDLRALHVFSAWVDHDDSRAINTLDVLVEGKGVKFVRHYQLDLASTLGSASIKANSARSGGEYLFSWRDAFLQLVTLGLHVPYWAHARYPDMPSVGRFESKVFDPEKWFPEYPNPAFINRLPDDEFWAAKQVMNFTDEDLAAIVKAARYSDPKAEDYILKCLIERRDKIGRTYFSRVLPLDRFDVRGGELIWEDLAARHGLESPGAITVEWSEFDNQSAARAAAGTEKSTRLPAMKDGSYWVARLTAPARPHQTMDVFLRRTGTSTHIVGIEHQWPNPAR